MNYASKAGLGKLHARKHETSETCPFFWAPTVCLLQSNRWNNENVTVKFKYYHEHQRTCGILIKFTYLMPPKLLYLLMDWETFNHLSALEQINGVIRAIQTSTMVLFAKVVCNVNWKALIILTKRLILDAWLGPVRASIDWYIIVLKNKTKIYKDERQVKMESL